MFFYSKVFTEALPVYALHQIVEDQSMNLGEASNSFIFWNETYGAQQGCQMITYILL